MDIEERFAHARLMQEAYPHFVPFCEDAMAFLGFKMTWMQRDIALYMEESGDFAMVQAQRGEAKSTIACIYGLWDLVHNPTHRVLLFSGSGDKADENGILMHGLVHNWEPLLYLAPDPSVKGQRTGATEFDVYFALKGVDKSPSVKCIGIAAGTQGFRADLLIPDDIETIKNGLSPNERDKLVRQSKEFTSICTHGKILYLGTPQTKDSVYNGLPARGFDVRIWPGRFPTHEEEEHYGDFLAPSIRKRLELLGERCRTGFGLDGSRGMPTDPDRFDESALCKKERDQGPEEFQLQYMLDTSLLDALRQQLRLRDLVVCELNHESVPETISWAPNPNLRVDMSWHPTMPKAELYYAASHSKVFAKPTDRTLVIDPAGDGGDELSYAAGGVLGPYIHVFSVGGFKGGFSDDNLEKLVELVKRFNIKAVLVEKNMGAGAVTKLILNYFNGIDPKTREARVRGVSVTDENSGNMQKERRIIDGVRPVMQTHRLIMHMQAIRDDAALLQQHSPLARAAFSVLLQMQSITTDRGCLVKDDRVDALEQLVRKLTPHLIIDEEVAARKRQEEVAQDFIKNPMGKRPFSKEGVSKRGRPKTSRAMAKRTGRKRR